MLWNHLKKQKFSFYLQKIAAIYLLKITRILIANRKHGEHDFINCSRIENHFKYEKSSDFRPLTSDDSRKLQHEDILNRLYGFG